MAKAPLDEYRIVARAPASFRAAMYRILSDAIAKGRSVTINDLIVEGICGHYGLKQELDDYYNKQVSEGQNIGGGAVPDTLRKATNSAEADRLAAAKNLGIMKRRTNAGRH